MAVVVNSQPSSVPLSPENKVPTVNEDVLVTIDCSGEIFITTEATLSNYPDTLLGNPQKRKKYYNTVSKSYFFDRNQDVFMAVLYMYQSPGIFRPPARLDSVIVEEELQFFDIDIPKMLIRYEEIELSNAIPEQLTKWQMLHRTITDSTYNTVAYVWSIVDLSCIFVTIAMLITESIPDYKHLFQQPFEAWYKTVIYSMDVFVNFFFTMDLIFKFLSWPVRKKFFSQVLNITDILAVFPFYAELAVFAITADTAPQQLLALKVCRIIRVVRALKIVRHSKQLSDVMEVLGSAGREFGMLLGLFGIIVLFVGTVMYFIEFTAYDKDNLPSEGFLSIPHGCWWCIITVTTVGYGDLYPVTTLGRTVGVLVVLFGIMVLAFPMSIIVSKFQKSLVLNKMKADQEVTRKLRAVARNGSCFTNSKIDLIT